MKYRHRGFERTGLLTSKTDERDKALESVAKRRILITYQELANALQILPPHSIHRVTEALERLMEEDAAADRPFIAALAISKARGRLPGPGFFDCPRRLGRFAGGPRLVAHCDAV